MALKVLMVDDHTMILDIFKGFFDNIDGINIQCASSKVDAIAALHVQQDFDLVVLDLNLQGVLDVTIITELTQRFPDVKFAAMSGSANEFQAAMALELGAFGFVPKNIKPLVLVRAIQQMADGEKYLPTSMQDAIGQRLPNSVTEDASQDQLIFMCLLSYGLSNSEIAKVARFSNAHTDKVRRGVYEHLGVANRKAAVAATRIGRLV